MTNEEWLNTLGTEEKAKFLIRNCNLCIYDCDNNYCSENTCENGIKKWLKREHIEPMPTLKVGDVLDVVLEDGCWYDGVYVAKGIVYILGECICKEITEVKIKSISRWSSGSMHEIWRG
jgi:hypothetical protein